MRASSVNSANCAIPTSGAAQICAKASSLKLSLLWVRRSSETSQPPRCSLASLRVSSMTALANQEFVSRGLFYTVSFESANVTFSVTTDLGATDAVEVAVRSDFVFVCKRHFHRVQRNWVWSVVAHKSGGTFHWSCQRGGGCCSGLAQYHPGGLCPDVRHCCFHDS